MEFLKALLSLLLSMVSIFNIFAGTHQVENPGGSISNVTFENFEIHYAASRPIGCLIYNTDIQNFNISEIKYKNISYASASYPNKIASNGSNTNSIQADFEDIYYNGIKITDIDSGIFEYDSCAKITIK